MVRPQGKKILCEAIWRAELAWEAKTTRSVEPPESQALSLY
jgi:hypothetical protein